MGVWGVPWGINQVVRQSLLDGLANHLGGPRDLLPHGHPVLGQWLHEAVSDTAATPW